MTFRCGHPREGNTYEQPNGERRPTCAFCRRVKGMVRRAKHDQKRINAGTFYTFGQRVARGCV